MSHQSQVLESQSQVPWHYITDKGKVFTELMEVQ